MTDIVHYRIPLGFLANIANALFVQKQLKHIFNFRFQAIEERFGIWQKTNERSQTLQVH
jgi:ligand-binding SRPBCC domain-containing protein